MAPLLETPPEQRVDLHQFVYGSYDLHHAMLAPMRSIRSIDWKYVRQYSDKLEDELYDLRSDPGELINLINDPARQRTVDSLRARLAQWQRAVEDHLAE